MTHDNASRIIASRTLIVSILFALLMACQGAKPDLALTITNPTADLTTNANVTVTIQIPDRTPDQFNALNVVLERKRASDPDAAYTPIATFDRTSPYPFTTTWDIKAETDGSYALRARATYTGGGFSSDTLSSVSQPRAITLDRQAPTITDRSPIPDAKNVSVRAPIKVTFSKPVLALSLTDTSVKLSSNSTAIPARTLALSADGKTLTITPGSVPSAPAKLEVALSDEIKDAVGNKLSGAGTWAWDAPAFVPIGDPLVGVNGTSRATQPAMALDANGNPVVAFMDSLDGTNPRVFVNRWDGSRWQALGGALSGTPGDTRGTSAPSLVVDASGRPVVAWMQSESVTEVAYRTFVWRWDGTNWKDLGNSTVSPAKNSNYLVKPSMAINKEGEPIIASIITKGQPDQLGLLDAYQSIDIFSANLNNWANLSDTLTGYNGFQFASSSNNTIFSTSSSTPIHFSDAVLPKTVFVNQLIGRNWSAIGNFPKGLQTNSSFIAIDSKGIPIVVWCSDLFPSTKSVNLQVSSWSGSVWQNFGDAFSGRPGKTGGINPVLAIDANDNPVAAWLEPQQIVVDGKKVYEVFLTRWNGSSWQAPIGPLSANPGATSASDVQLALDSSGTPVLAWSEEDGSGGSKVYVYRLNL
jgi:Bacterial Ig-like domain